jgi:FdhD protein
MRRRVPPPCPGTCPASFSHRKLLLNNHIADTVHNAPVTHVDVQRFSLTETACDTDLVATEEPLGIQLGYDTDDGRTQRELAVTMRTPGHDLELASGFLFCEGVIRNLAEIASIRHCLTPEDPAHRFNLLKVELATGVRPPAEIFERHSFISSSCGVCGKTSIEQVLRRAVAATADAPKEPVLRGGLLLELPDRLGSSQRVFGATGGIHAAALFDLEGRLIGAREDVGRHNALDKLVGLALAEHWLPLDTHILLLSGRASFELIQKAAMAGTRVVCAVGAPSSLAVECARACGITLVGFLRGTRFNIYSHPERIRTQQSQSQPSGSSLPQPPSSAVPQ